MADEKVKPSTEKIKNSCNRTTYNRKYKTLNTVEERTTRICLKCQRKFKSEGVHNRVCPPCNKDIQTVKGLLNF